jgi:hypothetical protein
MMSSVAPSNFNLKAICPAFCLQERASSTASSRPNHFVDSVAVCSWLRQYNDAFSRFEQMAAHGAYSLLQKEITNMTPLLTEGLRIAEASSHDSSVISMINNLVKPRLHQLQRSYVEAKKNIAQKPKLVEEDEKIVKKWGNLKLPKSILTNHIDFARFLMESGLAFKIVGYRETCRNSHLHDVKLDSDGQPMIKVQGAFKRWDVIKKELSYDSKQNRIFSLAYRGSIVQSWTYLSPNGLVPIDRLNHKQIPIYQLNEQERQRVLSHARKFYNTNEEIDPGVPKDWVVQFHTSPRRQFVASIPPLPDHPLLDNLARNLNTHIVMRLIAPNGDVYSFGLEMPTDSQEFLWENGMAKFLGTVPARICVGDYEEFRPYKERFVTNIPLSAQRAENILSFINHSGDVRFNFLRQNCASLMHIVLKQTGYDIETQTTVKDLLIDILPDIKHIPLVGSILDQINQVFKKAVSMLYSHTPKLFIAAGSMIFYVPLKISMVPIHVLSKISTVAINTFISYFGGGKMLSALPDGVPEDDFYNAKRFLNFSRLIRSWTDLFKEQTLELYHSKYFIDWQKQQESTFVVLDSSLPKLAILPPVRYS